MPKQLEPNYKELLRIGPNLFYCAFNIISFFQILNSIFPDDDQNEHE